MTSYRLCLFLLVLLYYCKENTNTTKHFLSLEDKKIQVNAFSTDSVEIQLPFIINSGYHIQLPEVENANLIPTTFSLDNQLQNTNIRFEYESHGIQFEDGTQLTVISNNLVVILRFKTDANINTVFNGRLTYQACDNKSCYFPRDYKVTLNVNDFN